MRAYVELTPGVPVSRSLLGFLLFCLLLVIISGGVVWYVGPTVAGIVVDGASRQNPFYLLQLLPTGAAGASDGARSFRAQFLGLAAEEAGELAWQGGQVRVVEGSVRLDVAGIQLVEFSTGADLVQLMTSSAYRELEASSAGVRQFGTSRAPVPLAGAAATIVVLYRGASTPSEALGVPGSRGWLALLPDYGGEVRWDAEVAPVRGAAPWERVLAIQFPDGIAAQSWLDDPQTVTERAIAGKSLDDVLVLLVQPSGVVGAAVPPGPAQ